MGKSRRRATSRKAAGARNQLAEAVLGARESLLEQDRARLYGHRHERPEQKRAYRHGYDEGSLVMGGGG